jgi:hypothetical protein
MDQKGETASFTSRAPIFFPRYSGVRPTIWPAMKMPMITYISMLIMPTPLPPKMQFSHMPTMGARAARGLRLSCSAFTAPQVTSVVMASKVAPAEVPKRISLPSRLPRCWSTGRPATAGRSPTCCPPLRRGAGDLVGAGRAMGGQAGFGFRVSK